MPRVVADRKRVASVRCELHLRALRQPASLQFFVKNRPNMRSRGIAGQVELHGDAFPMGVGVWGDEVTGDIPGENRDRVKADLAVVRAETSRERRRKPADESILHRFGAKRTPNDVPHPAFLRWQVADIFREEVDFHARMRAVRKIMPLAATMHWPI